MKRSEKIRIHAGNLLWHILLYGGLASLACTLLFSGPPSWQDVSSFQKASGWVSRRYPGQGFFATVDFLQKRAAGIQEINGVYVSLTRLVLPPVSWQPSGITAFARNVSQFAQNARCPVSVMVVPGAAAVLDGAVPAGAAVPDEKAGIRSLYDQLEGVQGLDVGSVLGANRKAGLYYRTDPLWTSLGAGFGAQVLGQGLGMQVPDPEKAAVYTVSRDFRGILAWESGDPFLRDTIRLMVPENLPEYVMERDRKKYRSMYMEEALDQEDQLDVFGGKATGLVRFEMDNDSDVRLMLVSDGHASSMVQFLLPYCRTITLVDPRYLSEDLEQVMEREMVNQLAVVCGWDSLAADKRFAACFGQLPENT